MLKWIIKEIFTLADSESACTSLSMCVLELIESNMWYGGAVCIRVISRFISSITYKAHARYYSKLDSKSRQELSLNLIFICHLYVYIPEMPTLFATRILLILIRWASACPNEAPILLDAVLIVAPTLKSRIGLCVMGIPDRSVLLLQKLQSSLDPNRFQTLLIMKAAEWNLTQHQARYRLQKARFLFYAIVENILLPE